MRAYILDTGVRIAPFDDAVGEVLVLNRRLVDYQKRVLGRFCAAVEVIDDLAHARGDEFLLIEDHLFLTEHFLRRALRQARRAEATGPLRFALADSLFLREKAPLGGLTLATDGGPHAPLPLWLWRGGDFAGSLAGAPLLRVAVRERTFVPDNLRSLRDDLELRYAVTREGAMSVRHWSHILDINQLALAAYWLDFSPRRSLWLLWRVLSALSLNKWTLGANLNVVGRKVDIHPTAWVAGSILGDGVQIGAHSTVFGSVLGERARVEGNAEVSLSVLGARAVASFHTKLTLSVCYPMSLASYPAMQMCVLGHRAMHLGGCFPIDMKLTHDDLLDVKVRHQGQVVDSGKKFLGICLGHRAIAGTGLWFNSGVEVPNDYLIVRDRDRLVTRIPPGHAGEALSLQDGALRPYLRR